jgi:hypothetical protein
MKEIIPDFFIIGAPKCGTSALHNYLGQSESIYMLRKEVHFFGSDLYFNRPRINYMDYQTQCSKAPNGSLIGDASVYYLRSTSAAEEIYQANPDAKIIISLRNPVDFMHSLHTQLLSTADELERDFDKALALEPSRIKGKNIPWHTHPVHALNYREMSHFNDQIKRYYDLFDHNNIKIVLLDDIAANAKDVCRDLFDFLGVTENSLIDTKVVNGTTDIRFLYMRIFYKTLFPADGKLRKMLPRILLKLIDYTCFSLMYKKSIKVPMKKSTRDSLLQEYSVKIDELSVLIGRDLSAWKG